MTDVWTAPAEAAAAPVPLRALAIVGLLVGVPPLACIWSCALFGPPALGIPAAMLFAGLGGVLAGARIARRTRSSSARAALVVGGSAGLLQGMPFLVVMANVLVAPLTGGPRPLAIVAISALFYAVVSAIVGGPAVLGAAVGQLGERTGRGRTLTVLVGLAGPLLAAVVIAALVAFDRPAAAP